jgi:hypothetical protein
MSGATVFMGLGMFFFGYTMAIGANAIVCAFLQGVMMVGVLIGIFATLAYGLDAFRNQSSEIFIMNMLFKVRPLLSLILFLQTDSHTELHVLWPLQLCQSLGRGQGPGRDNVRLWRDFHLPGAYGNPGIYVREENEELVGEA